MLPFDTIENIRLIEQRYEGPNTLVFLGLAKKKNRPLFVKLLKPQFGQQAQLVQRFQKEAKTCAQLQHPNIVKLEQFGVAGDYHFLALDWVNGQNLKEFQQSQPNLPLAAIREILRQLLAALAYAHGKGIVHRDVKPANILIDRGGTVQLTDFGLARILVDTEFTRQNTLLGSPAYMSPEQITGESLDGRSDLFSVGCVAYELLTGKQAFGGENFSVCLHKIINETPVAPEQLRDDVSAEWMAFIEKLLEKRAENRFADAASALAALEHLPVESDFNFADFVQTHFENLPETLPESIAKTTSSGKFGKAAIGVIAAVLLIAAVVWGSFGDAEKAPPETANLLSPNMANAIGDSTAKTDSIATVASPPENVPETVAENRLPESSANTKMENSPPQNEPFVQRDAAEDSAAKVVPDDSIQSQAVLPSPPENLPATLRIRVEPWAFIEIDGAAIDSKATALDVPLAAGEHRIVFRHPSFPPQSKTVQLAPGENRDVIWSFFDLTGYLWVEVRPWAEIYVNNEFMDSSPLKKPITLPVGEYLLELRHPQLQTYRQTIRIAPGDTARVRQVLSQ
ncbi:MAG: serine/threonine-protein kinase [Calditrichia bacterium]